MAQSYIEALLPPGQPRWNSGSNLGTPINVTFSFMTQVPSYYANDAKERNNFVALNQTQMNAARQALNLWSQVANITFTEVSDAGNGGQIRFGAADIPGEGAHAYYPSPAFTDGREGDVWINNLAGQDLTPGVTNTIVHEVGHALG